MEWKDATKDMKTLFDLAEEAAGVLADKATAMGWQGAQAYFRAGSAAAAFVQSAYLAMMISAAESVTAAKFVAEVKIVRTRMEQQLRRHLARVIVRLCRAMTID